MYNPFENLSKPDFPVFFRDRLASTNDYAKEILAEKREIAPFAIVCGDQFQGKGRRGNRWVSEPNANLNFSIGISSLPFPSGAQFQITMAASLAVINFLNRFPVKGSFGIKWPNDIFYEDMKIAGILIETNLEGNRITDAVIGIGINVNQQNFNDLNASSLKLITGIDYSLPEIFGWLLEDLKQCFSYWRNPTKLKQEYHEALILMGKEVSISMQGQRLQGTILDLDTYGRIGMEIEGQVRYFQESEISNLRFIN